MSSFPLEEQLNDESQASEGSSSVNIPILIVGIFIFLLAFLDMIIMYVIPNNRIRENKRKLPNADFKKPNIGIIIVHFLLHGLIMLIGIFTILYSLGDISGINHRQVFVGLIVVCVLTLFCWVIQIAVDFSKTTDVKSQMTIQALKTLISTTPPIDFAFVYTQDTVQVYDCSDHSSSHCQTKTYTCYSKTGVTIPIDSKINSQIYDFKDTPEMFYFTYNHVLNMSTIFKAQFDAIMTNIRDCDKQNKKVIDYYPMNTATYIVSKEKIPTYLKKSTKIASIILGVGIYYELSSKSVPYITYNQNIDVEVVDNVNYNNIFTENNCQSLGECSRFNKKPTPQ
ncbi:hypothetical protein M9Y10_003775 [Tritrichomonas musculus]|uniref:Transmembrane protein n=1 Tax=Tritrichomonas musculus TaxID=1915356 RepID=A0ABR2JQH8_9EUKA